MDIGSSSMLLLAQLVAPPLQPGPVRLPNSTIEQRSAPQDGPVFNQPNIKDNSYGILMKSSSGSFRNSKVDVSEGEPAGSGG